MKALTKKGLREWMNFYHDKWIELHNSNIRDKTLKETRTK